MSLINPFDEDDAAEFIQDRVKVYCPYCGKYDDSKVDVYDPDSFYDFLKVNWECQTCFKTFQTSLKLDDEHNLELKDPEDLEAEANSNYLKEAI